MRLTIAVGILSAQSSILPVASEKKIRSSDDSGERFSLQNALSAIGSTSFRGDGRGLLNRFGAGGIQKENKTPLTRSSTRSSSRALEDGKIVECNPAEIGRAHV